MSKRNFVPNDLNPDDSRAVSALYGQLLQRDIPTEEMNKIFFILISKHVIHQR